MYLGIDLMRTECHLRPKLTQISPQKRAPPVKSEREIEYVQRQKGEEVPPESPLLHVVAHDQSPGGNCITRGQWPYIPALTRAMRNRHVVLYDLNNPSKYITPNDLGGHLTSDLISATLITLVSMCILPLTASEAMAASK